MFDDIVNINHIVLKLYTFYWAKQFCLVNRCWIHILDQNALKNCFRATAKSISNELIPYYM